MALRPDHVLKVAARAIAALAMGSGASALAAADQDPYYNSGLFLLCDSPNHSDQLVCTTYMNGFAEGYIQNSRDRCYAPTGAKLKEDYVRTIRRDPTLLRDRSGGILFSLMERLSTTKCDVPGQKPGTKQENPTR